MDTAAKAKHRGIYQHRLDTLEATIARLDRRDLTLGRARAVVFCVALFAFYHLWRGTPGAAVSLGAALLSFVGLVIWHATVAQHHREAQRRAAGVRAGLCRMAGNCPPNAPQAPPASAQNPNGRDLNLFGPGPCMFALVCPAVSPLGQHRLAQWLSDAAPAPTIRLRQQAIAAWSSRTSLREDLTAWAEELGTLVSAAHLNAWAAAPPVLSVRRWRWVLVGCNIATTASALALWRDFVGPLPLLLAVVIQTVLARLLSARIDRIAAALEGPSRGIGVLSMMVTRLVQEPQPPPFAQEHLAHLADTAQDAAPKNSARALATLGRLSRAFEAQANQAFAPIGALLLWRPHWALAIEHWRQTHRAAMPRWCAAIGELEAMVAGSGYAFEQPDDVYADIIDGPACFEVKDLGHPLLAADACVRNDVTVSCEQPLLMVSGSNMSGKSTLLRSVGVAVSLAQAGLPVRASALRMTPLTIGTSLQVHDSITTGASRFYAEIARLRDLLLAAQNPPPLFFLFDEILHGTNSQDRVVGATAVLHNFLRRAAIGIVTTHDLSLTQRAVELNAVNVHFVDDIKDGKLHFDYRMRPGVVAKSNALTLMRTLGLVDD